MILYFAGNAAGKKREFDLLKDGIRSRLLSFAEKDAWGKEAFDFWTSADAPQPFFLDSGAFGALTRGAVIDLDRYCAYIHENSIYTQPYACLDVIGDWRGSARNYDIMLQKGLTPVPTFHMGSPDHELKRLLGMADYVALGGVVGAHENDMRPWLDRCFRIVKDFWPKKIHIFGVMAQWALERYPCYSADSSGALVGAGMGRVSLFKAGRIETLPWDEYARQTYDGDVMDHVSNKQAAKGSAHHGRRYLNVQAQLDLQRFITDVWTMRGISWEDSCAASTAPSATSTSIP